MVEIAVENTDRLIRLINDILDIERIESGTVVLHQERCDVADARRREPARRRCHVAEAAGVDARAWRRIEGVVWADADRIVQTLTNLLSNAVKFSPAGGVVTLSAARATAARSLFRVADEGRGIPTDKLETIFERFQQVDASDCAPEGRHRPRAGHLPQHRRAARRADLGRERAGRRAPRSASPLPALDEPRRSTSPDRRRSARAGLRRRPVVARGGAGCC